MVLATSLAGCEKGLEQLWKFWGRRAVGWLGDWRVSWGSWLASGRRAQLQFLLVPWPLFPREGGEYMNNYNNVNKSCSLEFGLQMTFPKTWDETIYPCSWWSSGSLSPSFLPSFLFLGAWKLMEPGCISMGRRALMLHQGFSWHSSLGQFGMRLWASICSRTMHSKHCQMPQVFRLVKEYLCCHSWKLSWDL